MPKIDISIKSCRFQLFFPMLGSLRIVLIPRDQFPTLETLEITYFSDPSNGLQNTYENKIQEIIL